MQERPIVFIDTETTGLGHLAQPWEIAGIRREPNGHTSHRVWQIRYDTDTLPAGTDPDALAVGRWRERGLDAQWLWDAYREDEAVLPASGGEWAIARSVHRFLADEPMLVGLGVHYDARMLSGMFLRHGLPFQPWHYGIYDCKTAAHGFLLGYFEGTLRAPGSPAAAAGRRQVPNTEALIRALEIEPLAEAERHTAYGDAVLAMRFYDRLQQNNR